MANQSKLSSLQPFELENIEKTSKIVTDTNPYHPPEDIAQLQVDVLNVFEGRVDISIFPASYQARIKDYYRFSSTWNLSKYPKIAKRTRDTLDLV